MTQVQVPSGKASGIACLAAAFTARGEYAVRTVGEPAERAAARLVARLA